MIGPQPFYIKFNITNLSHEQIILGDTWLQENDPHIIWSNIMVNYSTKMLTQNITSEKKDFSNS